MKKNILFLILSLMVIFTTACGGQATDIPKSENNTKSSAETNGGKVVQGVTDSEILVGTWATQSGPAAIYFDFGKGIDAYFKHVNDQGGVNGRKLTLKIYDDEYQPSKAVGIAKKLVEEDKVFSIVGPVCSSCDKATKPYLEKVGIPVVALSSGADIFVNPPTSNYFGLMPNYRIEFQIFAKYAVEQLKVKKPAFIYQNDDSGKPPYQAGKEEFKKKYGIDTVSEVPFLSQDVDLSGAALNIKNAQPDAIFITGVPRPVASIVKELKKLNINVPIFTWYVAGADTAMFDLAGKSWEGVISSSWLPLLDSDDPRVKTFKESFAKYYPNQSVSGFAEYGWAEAEVFVEGLKRAGNNLDWKNFITALESIKNWNGGMAADVTYSPTNRYGSTTLFMIQAKDGKLVKISEAINYKVE